MLWFVTTLWTIEETIPEQSVFVEIEIIWFHLARGNSKGRSQSVLTIACSVSTTASVCFFPVFGIFKLSFRVFTVFTSTVIF